MDSRKLKKSIFKANFYESRRLRRDGFIDYMVRDTNSRKIYTKPFSIARKLFSFLGILFLFGLSAITDSNIAYPQNGMTVKLGASIFYHSGYFSCAVFCGMP